MKKFLAYLFYFLKYLIITLVVLFKCFLILLFTYIICDTLKLNIGEFILYSVLTLLGFSFLIFIVFKVIDLINNWEDFAKEILNGNKTNKKRF